MTERSFNLSIVSLGSAREENMDGIPFSLQRARFGMSDFTQRYAYVSWSILQ